MRFLIFANGKIGPKTDVKAFAAPPVRIFAADGGARFCLENGIRPHAVVGDMDSLEPEMLGQLKADGVEILEFPARKDQTDLELALELAIGRGATEIIVLGALGLRWDMSIANVLLLTRSGMENAGIRIVDEYQEITLIRAGETLKIRGNKGDRLSLIPLFSAAEGITLEGLEYLLNNETLYPGSTRGISNILSGSEARIHLKQGMLLCVIEK